MADLSNLSAPSSLVPGQLVSVRGPGGVAGPALPTGEGGSWFARASLSVPVQVYAYGHCGGGVVILKRTSGPLCALDYMYDVGLICIRKRTPVRGSASGLKSESLTDS